MAFTCVVLSACSVRSPVSDAKQLTTHGERVRIPWISVSRFIRCREAIMCVFSGLTYVVLRASSDRTPVSDAAQLSSPGVRECPSCMIFRFGSFSPMS